MTYDSAGDSAGNAGGPKWASIPWAIATHRNRKSMELSCSGAGADGAVHARATQMFAMSGSDFNTAAPWTEGPRRMGADKDRRLRLGVRLDGGANLAKIDIRTQKVTIVPLPRPDALQPYQAAVDQTTCLDQYHGRGRSDEVRREASQWNRISPSDARRGDSLLFRSSNTTARCN